MCDHRDKLDHLRWEHDRVDRNVLDLTMLSHKVHRIYVYNEVSLAMNIHRGKLCKFPPIRPIDFLSQKIRHSKKILSEK